MKSTHRVLFAILLIAVIFISGCVNETTTSSSTEVQYKDSSNFLLSLSDLPQNENWIIEERGEGNINDVDAKALEYNWSGGYYILFKSSKGDKFTYLTQSLSIYPEEKILGMLNFDIQDEEPLSNPNIGGHSRAVKTRQSIFGQEFTYYKITFVKNNLLVSLASGGTTIDYLKLKELAQKAYDKIDGYGKPFDYPIVPPTSKTYTTKVYGFSMVQPSGWSIKENTQSIVQFDSPTISGKSASICLM